MSDFLNEYQLTTFKNLLRDYKPNRAVLDIFWRSNFAIIAGPTGAGKDALRNLLVSENPKKYVPVLSTTTREPRPDEKDGEEYYFSFPDKIEAALRIKEFFQAALVHDQQVSCLHIDEIKKLKKGQIGLSILIVQTEEELHSLKSDIKTVFIVPPSLTIMKQRMAAHRNLSKGELQRRLKAAKVELEIALNNSSYYCLVNDDLEQLRDQVDNFLQKDDYNYESDRQGRITIQSLLREF